MTCTRSLNCESNYSTIIVIFIFILFKQGKARIYPQLHGWRLSTETRLVDLVKKVVEIGENENS